MDQTPTQRLRLIDSTACECTVQFRGIALVWMAERVDRHACEPGSGLADHVRERLVGHYDATVSVKDGHAERSVAEHRLEDQGLVGGLLLGRPATTDVRQGPDDEVPARVPHDRAVLGHPATRPV